MLIPLSLTISQPSYKLHIQVQWHNVHWSLSLKPKGRGTISNSPWDKQALRLQCAEWEEWVLHLNTMGNLSRTAHYYCSLLARSKATCYIRSAKLESSSSDYPASRCWSIAGNQPWVNLICWVHLIATVLCILRWMISIISFYSFGSSAQIITYNIVGTPWPDP